jgi:UDP-N-acetylglucosamine 2-epimerase (non-hydrolysing)
MSKLFFEQLRIPRPDFDLEVGSGSHAVQTAEVMKRFEPVLLAEKPDAVVVVGDVNSTIACALTSVKLGVPVAHVEAGLRSFDRTMPEEINRILTDAISQWLFVSEPSGVQNLLREGVSEERIHLVGNVMIDTLVACRDQFEGASLADVSLPAGDYAVLTLHRPANVDWPEKLRSLLGAIKRVSERLPIVFPVHPRTRKALVECDVRLPCVSLTEPLGYLEFMKLVAGARLVLTDSGGIQEEAPALGKPVLVMRDTTERPEGVEAGTAILVGTDPDRIVAEASRLLADTSHYDTMSRAHNPFGDGKAALRIRDILKAEDSTKTNALPETLRHAS